MRLYGSILLGFPGNPLFPPLMKCIGCTIKLTYLPIHFTSGTKLLGHLLYVRNLRICYLGGGLVHPQKFSETLTPNIDFITSFPFTLIHTAALSHLVLYEPAGMSIGACFCSIRGSACANFFIYHLGVMILTGTCSHGSL